MRSQSIEPQVSVIMAVYNGERYLEEAIISILHQTFKNFEFIIIDDGSVDGTSGILNEFKKKDGRIKLYTQTNQGLIAALNKACTLVSGKYIARMDADDISLPQRIEKQVQCLESNREIGIVGSWVEVIDKNGAKIGEWRFPTNHGLMGWSLFFWNCFAHSSVMLKQDVLRKLKRYDEYALHAEDYELWTRAVFLTRLMNIPECLLRKRVWEESICSKYQQIQEATVLRVRHALIERMLNEKVPIESVEYMSRLGKGETSDNPDNLRCGIELIKQVYRSYINQPWICKAEKRDIRRVATRHFIVLGVLVLKKSIWHGVVAIWFPLALAPHEVIRELCRGIVRRIIRLIDG